MRAIHRRLPGAIVIVGAQHRDQPILEGIASRRQRRHVLGKTFELALLVEQRRPPCPELLAGKIGDLPNGGFIVQGVEFDPLGRRRAYWMFPVHPGEVAMFRRASLTSQPVPASSVLHLFDRLRPGQVRGVPWLAPVILKLRDLDEYDDAELVRKKIEACFAAFVTGSDDEETLAEVQQF